MGQLFKRTLGNILFDGGFLQRHDIDGALEEQKHTKELLGQVLVRRGLIKEEEITVSLLIQEQLGTIESAVKIVAGDRQNIGDLLVQSGQISGEQLDLALAEQKHTGEKLGEVCIRYGLLTERQLNGLLDFQSNQGSMHASPLRLGELLVATGKITCDHLEDALLKQQQSKKNIGDVLMEAGYARPCCIEYGVRLQKMLKKSVLSAILALGMSTASEAGECFFSRQLQENPALKTQYVAMVASEVGNKVAYNNHSNNAVMSDASEEESLLGFFLGKERSSAPQRATIDNLSKDCLACHDGQAARAIKLDYRNSPGHITNEYDGKGEHPIGMDYASYASRDHKNYKLSRTVNSKMIFVNGKVGCLTCHNPLNPEEKHLVMSNDRSALCTTCHKK